VTALPVLDLGAAPASSGELLRAAQAAFGVLPNLARMMVISPALLRGYLELTDEELAEIVGHVAVNVLTNLFAKAPRVLVVFSLVTSADDAA
jgi:hypothetical protein